MTPNVEVGPKLTARQSEVIAALEVICRGNVTLYKGISDHLYTGDLRKLSLGDAASVFGLGGLTFQVGMAVNLKPSAVLSTFKALERKGLVIREKSRGYLGALYWWPVGLAERITAEIEREVRGYES